MTTVWGTGLDGYTQAPALDDAGNVGWSDGPAAERRRARARADVAAVLARGRTEAPRRQSRPRRDQGLGGEVGAPGGRGAGADLPLAGRAARARSRRGRLNRDFIAVIRFQGPRANGMPELHKLTPTLGVLQDRGHKVALLTDGRMSGASGKVPAAIHVTPEAADGGPIAQAPRRRRHPPRRAARPPARPCRRRRIRRAPGGHRRPLRERAWPRARAVPHVPRQCRAGRTRRRRALKALSAAPSLRWRCRPAASGARPWCRGRASNSRRCRPSACCRRGSPRNRAGHRRPDS